MSSFQPGPFGAFSSGRTVNYASPAEAVSVGHFFNAVYAWMAVGLAVTAADRLLGLAQYAGRSADHPHGPASSSWRSWPRLGARLRDRQRAVDRDQRAGPATALFVLYSALMGLTLSVLFKVYTHTALAAVFAETAGLFTAMSVYGFVTKRDLTRLGSFLFMGLLGLIIATVVNCFVASTMMGWIISYAGIVIFVGLTAYDTQKLKSVAVQTGNDGRLASRMAVVGSLMLYLDFVNIFVYLLSIMNDRRQ